MEDLDDLVRYANNRKIASNLTDAFPHPYTEEDGKRFIEMFSSAKPPQVLCIDLNGEAIGAIGLHPQKDIWHRNAELGYWVAEQYWGKGIITAAVKAMVRYGFANLPINRIFARPFDRNVGSKKVLEKAGFTFEARLKGTMFKNGQVEDELIYSVRKITTPEK